MSDVVTGWVEPFPIPEASAKVINKLLIEEVCLRYGTPRTVRCDNGAQFTSRNMEDMALAMGFKLK